MIGLKRQREMEKNEAQLKIYALEVKVQSLHPKHAVSNTDLCLTT